MSSRKSMLTVDDLSDESKIYVLNKTSGDVNISLVHKHGNRDLVTIPKTWIPVQVTNFAPKDSYIDSPDFRKLVNKGVLVLVKEVDAKKVLESNEGFAELERLRKKFSDIDLGTDDVQITPIEVLNSMDTLNINPVVKDTIVRTDITDNDKITLIIAEDKTGTKLLKSDYEYIITSCDKNSELAKWAAKKANEAEGMLA